MFRTLTDHQKAVVYAALLWSMGVGAALLIHRLGLKPGFPMFSLWMSTPALTAFLMMLVVTRDGYSKESWKSLGVHRLGLNVWPIAFGVTLLLGAAMTSLVWATPLASFAIPKYGLLGTIIDFFFVLVVFTPTFILAEEIGMRGYLLPKVLDLGRAPALLLVGLVWGLWHLPLFYLTSLFPTGNALIFVPLVLTTIVAASFLFGYFRIYTGSLWPGAVSHAVHNSLVDTLGALTTTSSPVLVNLYLVGDNGILIVVSTALAALWVRHLFWGRTRRAIRG
ncbi:MAG: type II CAAX prenyl endopeptidase Rce1 family protein [Aeromicrobium sp.]